MYEEDFYNKTKLPDGQWLEEECSGGVLRRRLLTDYDVALMQALLDSMVQYDIKHELCGVPYDDNYYNMANTLKSYGDKWEVVNAGS